ncbi:thioredoxin family protein [Sphingobacterium hotanense]|uniref:thioredoxin family protein n=1 Tax=Sphingobacterium hotanense TaxID=649196 RepID=UPI0021A6C112|nr:thioredoxin fold domain-containing protein [Sphingobacterium hotanense]MCT1526959.1 thioredoxin fold domain-containing protein [Sphingobacterium hotanense]
MKKLLLLLFTIPFLAIGQDKGIHFEHNTTWAKVKEKAKAENKYIFVDAFTTWCGPCKWMASEVFPLEKVGTFFNEKFVNLKIQMDQTKEDNADVKSWYEEAKRFSKDYSINAYPTFLIFDPNGELVHRIVGGAEADDFIVKAGEGLNPETQFVTVVKKFEANPNDVAIAKATAAAAEKAYDKNLQKKAQDAVIANSSTDELLSKENAAFLLKSASNSQSKAFSIVRENKEKVDAALGAGKAATILANAIVNTEIAPVAWNSEEDNLASVLAEVEKKYSDINIKDHISGFKTQYYLKKKNYPAFKEAVESYIAAENGKVDPSTLNSFAWSIFENCDDPACVEAALSWSKKSIENNEDPALLDTYANLLHKSGKTKEAIEWQEKAIAKADADSKADYQLTLEKMKKGEPTWVTEEELLIN